MLKNNGLLFVRVNASDTDIYHSHEIIEKADDGGFTIQYMDGPKSGLQIHFFSREELMMVIEGSGLRMVHSPRKITIKRSEQRGSWSQWEMVAAPKV